LTRFSALDLTLRYHKRTVGGYRCIALNKYTMAD
jgi:hypothetical protein